MASTAPLYKHLKTNKTDRNLNECEQAILKIDHLI